MNKEFTNTQIANQSLARYKHKNVQHQVFYACKYVPAELIAGFGVKACYANVEANHFEAAEQLAHINLCGYAKSLLDFALSDACHELVLTTCCDAMKRLYDVLKDQNCLDFLYLIDLPHLNGPFQEKIFSAEIKKFIRAYSNYSGLAFDYKKACSACMNTYQKEENHVALVGAHAPLSLIKLANQALSFPVENHTCSAPRYFKEIPQELCRMHAGFPCEKEGQVACFDGRKTKDEDFGDEFITWYLKELLHQIPCMRMNDVANRKQLFKQNAQVGIMYHTMKFCDYYELEYSKLSGQCNTGVVKLETDGTPQSSGQLLTRIEAFNETLHNFLPKEDKKEVTGSFAEGIAMYVLGIDSGSTSTEAVILDENGAILAMEILPTGAKAQKSAAAVIQKACDSAGINQNEISISVSCGYGREAISGMDKAITEISCHARGAHALMPEASCIIDIGGQDSKAISIDEQGKVKNFVMNDKCAAGTGRFLEMMARTLELDLSDMSTAYVDWKTDVVISSMCSVFAESEVVSLIADNTPTADIIHGLNMSVANKTASLVKRVHGEGPFFMTGGVARNEGIINALETTLKAPVKTHSQSQFAGALGAALLGLESLKS